VPGRPDHGPFYLVQGLLNALPRYTHWNVSSGKRIDAYLALVPLLAAFAQRRFPYSTPGVEANDVLYGGETDYLAEIKTHLNTVVSRVVSDLTDLASEADPDLRASKILDFVNVLHGHVDLSVGDAGTFSRKLLGLVTHKIGPDKLHADTAAYLAATQRIIGSSS